MSTIHEEVAGGAASGAREAPCRVAVFYDDTAARERAVQLGNRLVQHFWQELDFTFSWWRFRYLEEPIIAESASLAAVEADILVFSVPAVGGPDLDIARWIHSWTPLRDPGVGVVVPLLHPATPESLSDSIWMVEIEGLAQQTGLECLLPSQLRQSPLLDDSMREVQLRSRLVGGVLDDILREQRHADHPQHWGLNE